MCRGEPKRENKKGLLKQHNLCGGSSRQFKGGTAAACRGNFSARECLLLDEKKSRKATAGFIGRKSPQIQEGLM